VLKFNGTHQVPVCADGINVLGGKINRHRKFKKKHAEN
jgi:hypothetical protein